MRKCTTAASRTTLGGEEKTSTLHTRRTDGGATSEMITPQHTCTHAPTYQRQRLQDKQRTRPNWHPFFPTPPPPHIFVEARTKKCVRHGKCTECGIVGLPFKDLKLSPLRKRREDGGTTCFFMRDIVLLARKNVYMRRWAAISEVQERAGAL